MATKRKLKSKSKSGVTKFLGSVGEFFRRINIEVNVERNDFKTNIRKNDKGDFDASIGIDGVNTGISVSEKSVKINYNDKDKI